MLQTTTATFFVQRAFRLRAVGTLLQNFHDPTPRKVLLASSQFHPAAFPGQATPHKAHAAIGQAGKSLAPLHQFFYGKFTNHRENIASVRKALRFTQK